MSFLEGLIDLTMLPSIDDSECPYNAKNRRKKSSDVSIPLNSNSHIGVDERDDNGGDTKTKKNVKGESRKSKGDGSVDTSDVKKQENRIMNILSGAADFDYSLSSSSFGCKSEDNFIRLPSWLLDSDSQNKATTTTNKKPVEADKLEVVTNDNETSSKVTENDREEYEEQEHHESIERTLEEKVPGGELIDLSEITDDEENPMRKSALLKRLRTLVKKQEEIHGIEPNNKESTRSRIDLDCEKHQIDPPSAAQGVVAETLQHNNHDNKDTIVSQEEREEFRDEQEETSYGSNMAGVAQCGYDCLGFASSVANFSLTPISSLKTTS